MTRVLLQPIGTDRTARQNYERSVVEGVPFADCLPYLSAADAEALGGFVDPLRLWGSTPTGMAGNAKARALAERRVGDVVVLYEAKTFIARARIAYLLENPALARFVWPADGPTWQHMMVLDDVERVSRPSPALLVPLGHHEVVRGIELLSEPDSAAFLRAWGGEEPESDEEALDILRDLVGVPIHTVTGKENVVLRVTGDSALVATERSPAGERVPALDVQHGLDLLRRDGSVLVNVDTLGHRSAFVGAVLASLPDMVVTLGPARVLLRTGDADADDRSDAETDARVGAKRRLEQRRLRRLLLDGEPSGTCALCGREFPAGLLVAAHIKRRAVCTPQERNDVRNVVMLACVFGCDALFENGYVSVDHDGTVVVSASAASLDGPVGGYLARLAGRRCPAHTPFSAEYFDWHVLTLRP
jgi:hypothetical protein